MSRLLGRLTSIDCAGSHYDRLGITDMVVKEGEVIVYIDQEGRRIETGEEVTKKDYDESNSDAIILNNKYILIWI